MKKYELACFILAAIVFTAILFDFDSRISTLEAENASLQTQLGQKDSQLSTLQSDKASLQNSMTNLQSQMMVLQNQTDVLENLYRTLQSTYSTLNYQYSTLREEYCSLNDSYNCLQKNYSIEKSLRIGNSLASYYDLIRQRLGSTGTWRWWAYSQSYWQTAAEFAAKLALHDLRLLYWPMMEEDYFNDVGEHSYDSARKIMDEVVTLLEINQSCSNVLKVEKILNFLDCYINYESEVNDNFLAPVETLGYKSGDCDDFTILASALFKMNGIDSAIGLFENDNSEFHAMVLLHLDNLGNYTYYYNSDLTGKGLDEGKWIIIEPQTTIENQGTNWVKQWRLIVAAPLDVEKYI